MYNILYTSFNEYDISHLSSSMPCRAYSAHHCSTEPYSKTVHRALLHPPFKSSAPLTILILSGADQGCLRYHRNYCPSLTVLHCRNGLKPAPTPSARPRADRTALDVPAVMPHCARIGAQPPPNAPCPQKKLRELGSLSMRCATASTPQPGWRRLCAPGRP